MSIYETHHIDLQFLVNVSSERDMRGDTVSLPSRIVRVRHVAVMTAVESRLQERNEPVT